MLCKKHIEPKKNTLNGTIRISGSGMPPPTGSPPYIGIRIAAITKPKWIQRLKRPASISLFLDHNK